MRDIHLTYRWILLSTFISVAFMSACGEGKPAKSPHQTTNVTESSASSTAVATTEIKRTVRSKYPDIFLEPDCKDDKPVGYLDNGKEVVRNVRTTFREKLKACSDEVPAGQELSGQVITRFRLDPDGVPRCVEAPDSTLQSEEVIKCVVHHYRAMRFPAPKGGSVKVRDELSFSITQQDDDDGGEKSPDNSSVKPGSGEKK